MIHEFATERCDQWLSLTEPFAQKACPAEGGAGRGSGIALHGDQGGPDPDLKPQFLPIPLGPLGQRRQCLQAALKMTDRFEIGRAGGGTLASLQPVGDGTFDLARLREVMRSVEYPEGYFYVERTLALLFGLVAQLAPKSGLPGLVLPHASKVFARGMAIPRPKPMPEAPPA